MSAFDPILWAPALQLVGLATACLARLSRGSRGQRIWGALFFVSLIAVAITTMASVPVCHGGGWLAGGASMCVMILLAVWERPKLALNNVR